MNEDRESPDHVDRQDPVVGSTAAVAAVGAELTACQALYLRCRADMENLRKRSQREREDAQRYALKDFLESLLPVLDSFDQALRNPTQRDDDQGLALIARQLFDALQHHGVAVIDPLGEMFDPDAHEVISLQQRADLAPHTVVAVAQKGYRLHGRLVRPARVVCASSL